MIPMQPFVSGGVVHFNNPEYDGAYDMELSSCTGGMVGAHVTVGCKRVSFSGSIDYISASSDITNTGWEELSDDEFDLSGVAGQFGVIVRL